MFQVNVTIGFNPETLAALNSLFAGMPKPGINAKEIMRPERPSAANGKAAKVTEPVKEPLINGEATEEQEEGGEGGTTTTEITMEQVRAAVTAKKQKLDNNADIKKLISEFGGVDEQGKVKLPEIKADKYAEFLTRLEALK